MYNNYNMNTSTYIFIGPQGSGKGTQAKFLVQKLDAEFVEMGGLLREISKQETEFGKHVKSLIDNGILLTDQDIEKILTEKLSQIDTTKKVIFDGVPRRIGQAEFLLKTLSDLQRTDIVTIYVNLPRVETFKRLSLRRVCEACKSPAISNADPNQVCEKCGGKLIIRKDDTPEAITKRLDLYENETLPVVDLLKERTRLVEIDGDQPIEKVRTDINQALGL